MRMKQCAIACCVNSCTADVLDDTYFEEDDLAGE